ncbi:MAG: GNAT family protein [Planctomycetota bacterium]
MGERAEQILSSERLELEPIQTRHAAFLFPILHDASIHEFIPTVPPESMDQLRTRYERLETRRSPDGSEAWLNWAIRVRATGTYIGTTQATVRQDGSALIAYELGAEFRGVGYAIEACQTVIDELVQGYGVGEIRAQVDTRNAPSIRLLERLSFQRIGNIHRADYFKDAWSDEYVYVRCCSVDGSRSAVPCGERPAHC